MPAAPMPITFSRRGRPRSFEDSPSEARKRSTAPGSPMTASPSPSLISWISSSMVYSWIEGSPEFPKYGDFAPDGSTAGGSCPGPGARRR